MKKAVNFVTAVLFCGLIFLVPLLFILQPKADLSEKEKRYLEKWPAFSLRSAAEGQYTEKLDSYVSDHFPGRDFFVGLNAYYDYWSGRQNTKAYLFRGGRLFAAPTQPDGEAVRKNMEQIDAFCEKLKAYDESVSLTLMLVPSSGSVLLGDGSYTDGEIIADAYARSAADTVDLGAVFAGCADPGSLYYRTDHHWTSRGAYTAACAYAKALGLHMPEESAYRVERSAPFYGSAYSGSGLWLTQPDTLEIWDSGGSPQVTNETGAVHQGLFYRERLAEADKYTVFLDGNHSLVRITGADGAVTAPDRRLLVIRDSFSNSMGTFLADVFQEVVLVDLRYYHSSLDTLITDGNITDILLEYSCDNFLKDANLGFLGLTELPEPKAPDPVTEPVEEPVQAPPYWAPPPALDDAFFDNALYLGDSVLSALNRYCMAEEKMTGTVFSSNPKLSNRKLINKGNNQNVVYMGRYRQLLDVLEETGAPILICAMGCNDLANSNITVAQRSFRALLEKVRDKFPDITIFVQSVMPIKNVQSDFNEAEVAEYNEWLRKSAVKYNYCYIALDSYFMGPDGTLADEYMSNPTHINIGGGRIWYEQLMNIENYHNFPEKYMVEYDGETHLPLSSEEAPGTDPLPEAEEPAAPAHGETGAPAGAEEPLTPDLLQDIYTEICSRVDVPDMISLNEAGLASYLGITLEHCVNGRFYICSDGTKTDEIWLVELDDAAAAREMLAAAEKRIRDKAESVRGYLPEEYAVAKEGIAVIEGRYLALFVSPEAETMLAVFREMLPAETG